MQHTFFKTLKRLIFSLYEEISIELSVKCCLRTLTRKLHRQTQLSLSVLGMACFWSTQAGEAQILTSAYITNRDSNSVSVINTTSDTVGATLSTGSQPIGVAVTPDGRFTYVTNSGSNTVSVFDATTNTALSPITVG